MKFILPLIALGFASCGANPVEAIAALADGPYRQCTLPMLISCEDVEPARRAVCVKYVGLAVEEINQVSGRELLQFVEFNGNIPVVFSDSMVLRDGPGFVVLGETAHIVDVAGCMAFTSIHLNTKLLAKSWAADSFEVVLHEVLHAMGQIHSAEGVMTPNIGDKGHTKHMSVGDIHRLKAVYGK